MKIQDLFVADVTRDIPPVVYFHEQSPEKLKAEVSEYIITGGWPEDHPNGEPEVPKSDVPDEFDDDWPLELGDDVFDALTPDDDYEPTPDPGDFWPEQDAA